MKSLFALTLLVGLALASPAYSQLEFNPAIGNVINFEDTPVGETAELNYTVINNNRSNWNVSIRVEAPFSGDPAQFMVQGGGRANFRLRFTPEAAGDVSRDLTIAYWSGNQQRQLQSRLTGTGTDEGGDGPQMEVAPDTLDLFLFADELGSIWDATSADLSVQNTGDDSLVVRSITSNVNWLTIEPTDFELTPGDVEQVTVSVIENALNNMEPDLYRANLTITSNDPDQGRLVVPVVFERGFIPNYLVVLGEAIPENLHALIIEDATIGDAELQEWDEVGVFTPRDDLAGSGYFDGEWPFPILVWGEDQESGFNGFRAGDEFTFRLFDHSAGMEYEAVAEFIQGPTTFESEGISGVILMTAPDGVEQTIILRAGFNLISFNVSPEERYWQGEEGVDIRTAFESIRDHVLLVKNERGEFYTPPNRDFNNIPFWPLNRGMMVRMSEADTLVIRGVPIEEDAQIAVNGGWNFVAYYPDNTLTMGEAYAELVDADRLVIAKNVLGQFFAPRYGFGGGTVINPNDAIQLKVSEDCTFQYPNREGRLVPPPRDGDYVTHFPQPVITDVCMNVLVDTLIGVDIIEGAEFAALTPDNLVAGVWKIDRTGVPFGMALWGDSGFTADTIEGFKAGEGVRFLYWDPVHNWELEIAPTIIEGGPAVYSTNNLLVIGAFVGVKESDPISPARFELSEPFPNPFNQRLTVNFSLARAGYASLDVVDAASGRRVSSLLNGFQPAGEQTLAFDGEGLPTGVYMVVLKSNGHQQSRKVLLLK